MDYTKFFSKMGRNLRHGMIRQMTEAYDRSPNSISLASGMPNSTTFPFKEIVVTYEDGVTERVCGDDLTKALQYGPSRGFLPLIEKWRHLQETRHSMKYNDWDVAFTVGSQDGSNKIFGMFLESGEPILVQTPAYTGTFNALYALQPNVIEITQDADGIIPQQIADVCADRAQKGLPMPKLLYINPTGANPTGTILSDSRKRQVYKLAQQYNFLILEDDPYYFVHFLNELPTSMLSLDTDGRVIRLDSFSKIISAGIRVGALTAHKDIVEKFVICMENTVLHTSSLSQMLLYKLLESWDARRFEAHIKSIQNFYRAKRDSMLAAIEKHLTGLAEWNVPKGGMFFWIEIKGIDNILDIANKCMSDGLFVVPGNAFYYDTTKSERKIRLCYSHATPEEIDKGLAILAQVLRRERNLTRSA